MKSILLALALALPTLTLAQEESMDTYYEIPEAPEEYISGSIVARMVDGLGYRYYWATKDLREEDLAYKPSDDARSTGETLEHIYGLSLMIRNSSEGKANIRPSDWSGMSAEDFRTQTLSNLEIASKNYAGMDSEAVANLNITFQSQSGSRNFPFWNMLNGPLADALYHTGQVVSFRRASGNPIDSGVNVFMGKTREK